VPFAGSGQRRLNLQIEHLTVGGNIELMVGQSSFAAGIVLGPLILAVQNPDKAITQCEWLGPFFSQQASLM
jgi:hypothetical protein